jgi:hypothetical protein
MTQDHKDYMIFDITDLLADIPVGRYAITADLERKDIIQGTVKDIFPRGKVSLHTGFSGLLEGELASTWSSLRTTEGSIRVRQLLLLHPLRKWNGSEVSEYV